MVCSRVVLGVIVTEVSAAGFPINQKLFLEGAISDPIKTHVNGFGAFLFDGVVGKALSSGVVNLDGGGGLWVAKLREGLCAEGQFLGH